MSAPWPGSPEARRHHEPRRDSEVAAWLRRHRDRHDFTAGEGVNAYQALDDVLDDYRLHADTGTPLDEDSETGSYGGQCGCGVRADDSPVPGLRDRTAGQLGLCGEDPGAMRCGPAALPTDGQAPAEHYVEAFRHDGGCRDWGWQCFTCGEEDCGYDSLAKAERAGDQHRVVALAESATPADDSAAPPAGLSPVLASIEDVRRVCEAAGLPEDRPMRWTDDRTVEVLSGPAFRDGGYIVWALQDSWSAQMHGGTPASLLWHAIQAARSAAHPDSGEQHG